MRVECCACGNASKELAFQSGGLELVRGLAYLGNGKWLCPKCTRTAVGDFARQTVAHHKKQAADAPVVVLPGFDLELDDETVRKLLGQPDPKPPA